MSVLLRVKGFDFAAARACGLRMGIAAAAGRNRQPRFTIQPVRKKIIPVLRGGPKFRGSTRLWDKKMRHSPSQPGTTVVGDTKQAAQSEAKRSARKDAGAIAASAFWGPHCNITQ
jgi:hypothetical protein